MSVTTASVGRLRLPELATLIALAIVGALTVAVLAVLDATRTGSHQEVPAPVAQDVPTPAWLEHYLEFEAPAPVAHDVPNPGSLQGDLVLGAP